MKTDEAYPLIRSVSKTGTFALALNETRGLSEQLSSQEAAELYVLIREKAKRLEREWRGEFLRHFPQASALLPASLDPEFEPGSLFEVMDAAVRAADPREWYDTFEELLEEALDRDVKLGELRKDGLSLREYAVRAGDGQLLEILDEHLPGDGGDTRR